MFAEHGTVNSCVIMRDDDDKSKVRWGSGWGCGLGGKPGRRSVS